jgi:hypothetical protein
MAQRGLDKNTVKSAVPAISVAEKDSIIRKIFNRIYDASGVLSEKPEVKLSFQRGNAASYTPSKKMPVIAFENDALDVCLSFVDRRDDAIAFILSHEIGHHFTHRFWEGNYADFELSIKDSLVAKYGLEMRNGKVSDRHVIRTLQEIKADEKGNILLYMAGFSSDNLAESLWRKIYEAYPGFSDTMACYPPLQDRLEIARIAETRARSFARIFELANYAVLINDYDFAVTQYNALLFEFDFYSREIYNNIGVVYYLKAMAEQGALDYIYPIELDLKARNDAVTTRGSLPKSVRDHLAKARDYFKKAIQLDEGYATGYLNLGCILTILGEDYDGARSACKTVLKNSNNPVDVQNAKVVLALIDLKSDEGDKNRGRTLLEELVKNGCEFARLNMLRLEENDAGDSIEGAAAFAVENNEYKNSFKREMINGMNPETLDSVEEERAQLVEYGNPLQQLLSYNFEDASVLLNEGRYIFVTTEKNYSGTTALGIKIGSGVSEVKEKYGRPHGIMATAQGTIYHYPGSSLIMLIDVNNKVSKWVLYTER